MAAQSIKAQVEELVGSTSIASLDDWCGDAITKLILTLPYIALTSFTEVETVVYTGTYTEVLSSGKRIFEVRRATSLSSTAHVCREISPEEYAGQYSDTSSLYYPTEYDPIYAVYESSLLLSIEWQTWEQVSPTSVRLICYANRLTTAVLNYGTESGVLPNTVLFKNLARYHEVTITGLLTDQEYYFQWTLTDTIGGETVIDEDVFNLSPLITPLAIEAETVGHFAIGNATYSTAEIEFITNRLTTAVVNYGIASDALINTLTSATPTRYHDLTISNLILEQTIYYQIVVTDSNGDTITSSIDNFVINNTITKGLPIVADPIITVI